MARNLLIIAHHFAPSLRVGAQRPTKLVRHIERFGYRPFVLTVADGCRGPVDPAFGRDALERCVVSAVPCRSPWNHSAFWRRARSVPAKLYYRALRLFAKLTGQFLPMDEVFPWAYAATDEGVRMVRRHNIDLIWATSGPMTSLVLARRIGLCTGVPYVVDFRDAIKMPVDRPLTPREIRLLRWERLILRDAAGMTHVVPVQREELLARCPPLRQRPVRLVYNWMEPAECDALEPHPFDGPTIFHGGTFHGGSRRLDCLVAALGLLAREGAKPAADLRLVHHGSEPPEAVWRTLAVPDDLRDRVQLEPMIPRAQFLAKAKGAAVLLVAVGRTFGADEHAGTIPGKVFDYLPTCRPILVIGPPGCEAAGVIERLNRGIGADMDSPADIADALRRLLAGQGRSRPLDLTPQAAREFDPQVVIGGLCELFDEVLRQNHHRRGADFR